MAKSKQILAPCQHMKYPGLSFLIISTSYINQNSLEITSLLLSGMSEYTLWDSKERSADYMS